MLQIENVIFKLSKLILSFKGLKKVLKSIYLVSMVDKIFLTTLGRVLMDKFPVTNFL